MMEDIAVAHAEAASILSNLLAELRALHWHYWTAHWQSIGATAYVDHLMFERLYNSIVEEVDGLAEKMVGAFGNDAVNAQKSIEQAHHAFINRWSHIDGVIERSLVAEDDLQLHLQQAYDSIKRSGAMTLGLDDFLMSLANAHETNAYLLQQRAGGVRAGGKTAQHNAPSAENWFVDTPMMRSVRELAQSGAISNDRPVAIKAVKENAAEWSVMEERRAVNDSPLTPNETIKSTPGSDQFATLSTQIVQTEQPTDRRTPQGFAEVNKAPDPPDMKLADWTFAPRRV